jgi:DNA-binding MarR family transcriptional regulator
VTDIGGLLGVTNAGASQMVDRLVQNGLVERSEDPFDRRVKQLKLTERGRLIVQESIEVRRRWLEELTYALTKDEQASFITSLTMLTKAARNLDPGINQVEDMEEKDTVKKRISVPNQVPGKSDHR